MVLNSALVSQRLAYFRACVLLSISRARSD